MIKRILALVLTLVVAIGLLTGCSLFESSKMYAAKFDDTGATIAKDAPIRDAVFLKNYTSLFDGMDVLPLSEDMTEEDMENMMSWSQAKTLKISEASILSIFGKDKYDGFSAFASVDEDADTSLTWAQMIGSKQANLILMCNNTTEAAKTIFGESVHKKPFDAIKETCGNPTMVMASDEEENINVVLYYQFEDFAIMLVTIKNDDGKTWDISIVYTKIDE